MSAPIRTTAFVGVSVDGFLARANGALDFLPDGGGEDHGYAEFFSTVDALVIGRKTYETVLGFPDWPYGRKPVIVLSARPLTMPSDAAASVERMEGDPAVVLSRLAAKGIRHVYVDGGVTIQAFLAAGRLDRLVVTRVPVLIGTGIPLFGTLRSDIRLRHVSTRSFPSGLVTTEYAVAPPAPEGEGS